MAKVFTVPPLPEMANCKRIYGNSLQRFHFFDGTFLGRWYPKGLPLSARYLKGLPDIYKYDRSENEYRHEWKPHLAGSPVLRAPPGTYHSILLPRPQSVSPLTLNPTPNIRLHHRKTPSQPPRSHHESTPTSNNVLRSGKQAPLKRIQSPTQGIPGRHCRRSHR